jgi:translation initiation factor IF-3
VIAEGNRQLGVLDIADALRAAADAGVDLVEVRPLANPPVCWLMKREEFEYLMRELSRPVGTAHVARMLEDARRRGTPTR